MTDPHPNLLVEHIGDVIVVTLKPDDFFDQQTDCHRETRTARPGEERSSPPS